jgi:hypothetical protein
VTIAILKKLKSYASEYSILWVLLRIHVTIFRPTKKNEAFRLSYHEVHVKLRDYCWLAFEIQIQLYFLSQSGCIVWLLKKYLRRIICCPYLRQKKGSDITLIGWGAQLAVLKEACEDAAKDGVSCELIDLKTLIPWDKETVEASVKKTGKLLVSHEAPITGGFGAEIAASIAERCFQRLEAPVARVCGVDTPFPLVYEPFYMPTKNKVGP